MHGSLRSATAAVATAGLLALTGCASTVSGHGIAANIAAPSTPSLPPTPAPSTPAPGSSTQPVAPPAAGHLAGLLVARPAGAVAWDGAWARNVDPSVRQFVAYAYPKKFRAIIANILRGEGLAAIAHRTWITRGGDAADVILLQFRSGAGARSRYLQTTTAKLDDPAISTFRLAAPVTGLGTFDAKDARGYVHSIVYVQRGEIVIEVFGSSQGSFHRSTVVGTAMRQLARLP